MRRFRFLIGKVPDNFIASAAPWKSYLMLLSKDYKNTFSDGYRQILLALIKLEALIALS